MKKLGFDVEPIRNEHSLSEKLLEFAPDLVVATGDGHRVNGIRVGKKVKGKGRHTKLLLLFPRNRLKKGNALDEFHADGAVETPLDPRTIISSVCQLTGVSEEFVISKFEKLPIAKEAAAPVSEIQIISGKKVEKKNSAAPEASAAPEVVRPSKYSRFTEEVPATKQSNFDRHMVYSEVEAIRREEKDDEETRKIDEERRQFVVALFKK